MIKCITNVWLLGILIIKGRNSGRNKITRDKGGFRDGVWLKHLNGFKRNHSAC